MNRREILRGLLASAAAVASPAGVYSIIPTPAVVPPTMANYAALCAITRDKFLPMLAQDEITTFIYMSDDEPVRFAYMRTVDMPS